jgi:hypothetical protein
MSETTATLLNTARAMAQALVKRDTDINEFAKVATYVRTHHNGTQFFRLLETMVKDGHLVRSGRTLDYYRNIQEVCRQHLGTYRQAKDEQAQELAEILGWTTRLMRFYKEQGVPPAERQTATRARSASLPQASRQEEQSRDVKPAPASRALTSASAPAKEVPTREVVTLVEDAKNRQAQVESKAGERFRCTDLPAYPTPKKGTRCRADVMRRDGKVIRAIFKGLQS